MNRRDDDNRNQGMDPSDVLVIKLIVLVKTHPVATVLPLLLVVSLWHFESPFAAITALITFLLVGMIAAYVAVIQLFTDLFD